MNNVSVPQAFLNKTFVSAESHVICYGAPTSFETTPPPFPPAIIFTAFA